MAHYAKVESGVVTEVIVAEQAHIDTLSGTWVQTSYNSNIRKNFAGIGSIYDSTRDAFYMPQPYNSWTLNEDSCEWQPPTAYPNDGKVYGWDESTTSWKE
jgi:hypothetical protein